MPARELLERIVPAAAWVRTYSRRNFRSDAIAGVTTAVMLVPQSMAYAMLAGLPPVVGLYASTLPLVLYALFGSSRELAVGPVAMDSLLVAAALAPIAAAGSAAYLEHAAVLAALVGLIAAGLGLCKAGFVVDFVSRPVMSGFTSAAALIIGLSQLKHLLGIDIPRTQHVFSMLAAAVANASSIEPYTLGLGLASIAALVVLKRHAPKLPRGLLVVLSTTTIVWAFDLVAERVTVVGDVPPGLPPVALPDFDASMLIDLAPAAFTIALIGFMEAVSVAKTYATRRGYEVSANAELIGIGAANVGAAVVGGYPVTGGFSRTAVNAEAGARTPLAGVITSSLVALTLLWLTPLFYFLPNAALAAVIMTAVFGLVDLQEARRLWTADRADFVLLVLTFLSTLLVGIQTGLMVGVGASVVWFVARASKPHTAILGRLPGTTEYRNIERHREAVRVHGVVVVRVDASVYFGNVAFVRRFVRCSLAAHEGPVYALVIDATGINRLDSSACKAFDDLRSELAAEGVQLRFAGLKGPVIDALQRVSPSVAHDACLRVHDAVQGLLARRVPSGDSSAPACPDPAQAS